mmetsp:Transcript_616/g.1075  ORF Transcript_616/g.1075 Transcript_616/m.1075 type:complete len:101 (+) Transcript_616:757-1059(+)
MVYVTADGAVGCRHLCVTCCITDSAFASIIPITPICFSSFPISLFLSPFLPSPPSLFSDLVVDDMNDQCDVADLYVSGYKDLEEVPGAGTSIQTKGYQPL